MLVLVVVLEAAILKKRDFAVENEELRTKRIELTLEFFIALPAHQKADAFKSCSTKTKKGGSNVQVL